MTVPLDQETCTHQGAPIQRKCTLCSRGGLAPMVEVEVRYRGQRREGLDAYYKRYVMETMIQGRARSLMMVSFKSGYN